MKFFKIALHIARENDYTALLLLLSSFQRCTFHSFISPLQSICGCYLRTLSVCVSRHSSVSFSAASKPFLSLTLLKLPGLLRIQHARHFPCFDIIYKLVIYLFTIHLLIASGVLLYSALRLLQLLKITFT